MSFTRVSCVFLGSWRACFVPWASTLASSLDRDALAGSRWAAEDFAEDGGLRMVETSHQERNAADHAPAAHHLFGNVFLNEGCFRPIIFGKHHRGHLHHQQQQQHVTTAGPPSTSSSLFTIDSILAPRPKPATMQQRPTTILQPSAAAAAVHLGHLAAAASGGFGAAPADFLGMYLSLS